MGRRRGTRTPPPPIGGAPPEDDSGDVALVRAAQRDPACFPAIFDKYWSAAFALCYRQLGDWAEAEDAAQQAMLQVSRDLPAFAFRTGERDFRAWLMGIAWSRARDAARRRQHRAHVPFPETLADALPDADPGPEEDAIVAESHEEVRRLLARLADDQRAVMELRLAGLTTREIAEALGKTEENVRQLTLRARRRLEPLMDRHQGGAR